MNNLTQVIKLCQMNAAIMGYRLNRGEIPPEIVAARPDRYDAFAPYDLTSYGKGLLDAVIPGRDVFPETRAEKAQWLAVADSLESEWAMREIGMPHDVIRRALAEKAQARRELASAFSVAGAGTPQENDREQNQDAGQRQGEAA